MYFIRVRDRVMIAHSFKGQLFGPAQRLHGATYVVDVTFERPELTSDGVVVDLGRAHEVLHDVLGWLAFQNLDDLAEFKDVNTTTEYLAHWVFDRMRTAVLDGSLGPGSDGITALNVEFAESDVAWAGYRGTIA